MDEVCFMKLNMKSIFKLKPVYLVLFLFLLISIFEYNNSFITTEGNLQDSEYQGRHGLIDHNINILTIDDESLAKLGKWPWPRNIIADIINKVSLGKPAVIGVDITFSDKGAIPGEDEALANAIKKAGNVVLPVQGDFADYRGRNNAKIKDGKRVTLALYEPLDIFKDVAVTGHVNGVPDIGDGITRWSMFSFLYKDKEIKSFDWAVYNEYIKKTKGVNAVDNIPKNDTNDFFIDFIGRPKDYYHYPVSEVLDGTIRPEYFKDKIVLIGAYTTGMAKDFVMTPIDHNNPMYGVEVHANIIQDLKDSNFKKEVSLWLQILLLLLLTILSYFIFERFSPVKSALIMVGSGIIYYITAILVYNNGFILRLFYPGLLIVAVYFTMLAHHYIKEYLERRRITGVFGKYVAPQVVKQILEGGEDGLKLGGTRREITALFVDIRGFTPMSEKCSPEEVVGILNDYLDLTATSIFEFGGTLDKFIGDATMAIFNAPLDLKDHAFKAVQTAWAMKQGSVALRQKLEAQFGRGVQFGIGVNTGDAVVGNIGAKFRMDYTAIGDTVNTAARLESNAKPGQILISRSTYEMVKDRVKVTDLGEIKVKGKEQGVPVYQLDGICEG
jgi:adenylate cyclase